MDVLVAIPTLLAQCCSGIRLRGFLDRLQKRACCSNIPETDCGLGADKALVACSLCAIEPEHRLMPVDCCAPAWLSQARTTAAHDRTARVDLSSIQPPVSRSIGSALRSWYVARRARESSVPSGADPQVEGTWGRHRAVACSPPPHRCVYVDKRTSVWRLEERQERRCTKDTGCI